VATAVVVRRVLGFLPDLRYAAVVGAGVAAMVAVIAWLPAPTLVVSLVAVATYGAILAVAPGAGRETLSDLVSHHFGRGSRGAVTPYDAPE
jgi:hypothetical protein